MGCLILYRTHLQEKCTVAGSACKCVHLFRAVFILLLKYLIHMAVYVVPEAYRQWGAVSLMHETGEKCIEMPGPKNGTPLTRLLWPFGCKVLKSQCTKRVKSASKCLVRKTAPLSQGSCGTLAVRCRNLNARNRRKVHRNVRSGKRHFTISSLSAQFPQFSAPGLNQFSVSGNTRCTTLFIRRNGFWLGHFLRHRSNITPKHRLIREIPEAQKERT